MSKKDYIKFARVLRTYHLNGVLNLYPELKEDIASIFIEDSKNFSVEKFYQAIETGKGI